MFFQNLILDKKGPLARIWLAAHWDKKLTKAHVFETNIDESVDGIIAPKMKMALRTSGHLLVGVVRIFSHKAGYLQSDCNEALVKIKMAFRPENVDYQPAPGEGGHPAEILLPPEMADHDVEMPVDQEIWNTGHTYNNEAVVDRPEDITLREDQRANLNFNEGETGFGALPEDVQQGGMGSLFHEDSVTTKREAQERHSTHHDDGESGYMEVDDTPAGGLFEDAAETNSTVQTKPEPISQRTASTAEHASIASVATAVASAIMARPGQEPTIRLNPNVIETASRSNYPEKYANLITLAQNNAEESFTLAPLESYMPDGTRKKRIRRLVVDDIKNITGDEMKAQMKDASDIVTTLDLAPPTKQVMKWKETGGATKLFKLPARMILSDLIAKTYLTFSKPSDVKPVIETDGTGMDLQAYPDEEQQGNKNKRKKNNNAIDIEEEQTASSLNGRKITKISLTKRAKTSQDGSDGTTTSPPLEASSFASNFYDDGYGDGFDDMRASFVEYEDHEDEDGVQDSGNRSQSKNKEVHNIDVLDEGKRSAGETDEQFETKRAAHFIKVLKAKFSNDSNWISFESLTMNNNRKQVVQKFYALLVLQKHMAIDMRQDESYGELRISKGTKFNRKIKC